MSLNIHVKNLGPEKAIVTLVVTETGAKVDSVKNCILDPKQTSPELTISYRQSVIVTEFK